MMSTVQKHNVFMRVSVSRNFLLFNHIASFASGLQTANFAVKDPTIQKITGSSDPVQVMAKLREMKNSS